MNNLYCVACGKPLFSVPIFNGGSPDYPPSFLFCTNTECPREGLLTVMYKTLEVKEEDGKTVVRSKVNKRKVKKIAKSEHKTV